MTSDEASFRLLVPRRASVAAPAQASAPAPDTSKPDETFKHSPPESVGGEPAFAPASTIVDTHENSEPAACAQTGAGARGAPGADQEPADRHYDSGAGGEDPDVQAALGREAIALAEIACARMLARALVEDDRRTIESFVADALAAAGPQGPFETRLNPRDAAAVAPAYDPIADPALTRGSVVVSTAAGTLRTDMQERAGLLVRAAAHKR